MKRYDVNDLVRVRVKWRNLAGAFTDPTLVKAGYKSPSGVTTQVDPGDIIFGNDEDNGETNIGHYYTDVKVTEGNDDVPWFFRWEATGAVEDAVEITIPVRTPHVVLT
jgi:hypothetical protein